MKRKKNKSMISNCFFFLIFLILCFKNNFLFLKLKNLFGTTQNWQKTKIVFKTQFVNEIENMQKVFLV